MRKEGGRGAKKDRKDAYRGAKQNEENGCRRHKKKNAIWADGQKVRSFLGLNTGSNRYLLFPENDEERYCPYQGNKD